MVKVSVLIPVYGVEDYIEEFLKSLVRQDLKECEFIIVNDASKDNCHEIIQSYLDFEPRIIYVNKLANEGEMKARQDAFDIARGEYIINIDSDDCISDEFLSSMYQHAVNENLDMCLSNVKTFDDSLKKAKVYGMWFVEDLVFDVETLPETLGLPYATWCRLVKKELLINYRYRYQLGETDLTKLQYIAGVRSGVAKNAIHFYRQRRDSLSSFSNSRNKYSQPYSLEKIDQIYKEDLAVLGDKSVSQVFLCFRYLHMLKLIFISYLNQGNIVDYVRTERYLSRKYNISLFSSFTTLIKFGKRDRLFAILAALGLSPLVLVLYRFKK